MKTLASSPQRNSPPLLCNSIFSSCIGALWESWLLNGLAGLRLCVPACFSLCVRLSMVGVPLCQGVNPLILNQADVLAHRSLSSRPVLLGSLLLNLRALAKRSSFCLPVCSGLLCKLAPESCQKLHTSKSECKHSRCYISLYSPLY